MARSQVSATAGAPRRLVFLGVLILVLAAAATALYMASGIGGGAITADELGRVVVVAASPDENGDVVAQVITIVDLTAEPAALEPVSPAREVTIPGTSYSALGDAYPFGGGSGVAEALARAEGGDPLPYVAIGPEALSAAVKAADGVEITLPSAMSVFDGDDLYTFKAGEQMLDAAELAAVFKGAPYLAAGDREKLDAELASVLASLVADEPDVLAGADTDLDADALEALRLALGGIER